jgi:hypothetical protein
MFKTTMVLAAFNVAKELAAMAIVSIPLMQFSNISEPLVGGIIGGACRWIVAGLGLYKGASSVVIGCIMAVIFDGVRFPVIGSLFEGGIPPLAGGFLWGAFGVLIFGLVQDLLSRRGSQS